MKSLYPIPHTLNPKQGFTILEMLVVLAIIAVLSAIGITQFSNAQQKSRDVKRLSDVREIKKALNLYQIDNIRFPIQTTELTITGDDSFSTILEASGFITEVPTDPQHPGLSYTYQSNSAGSDYDIRFCLETDTVPNYSQGCGNTISP
jgi:general secretion pathway protein G